jgi:hypothetical protein
MNRSVAVIAFVIALASHAATARADCAASADYFTTTSGSTVDITVSEGPECGSTAIMLRQNIDTGELVQLSGFCDGTDFVDECVAPGNYRYGLATPLTCGGCGGTPYFAVVDVDATDGACTRTTGDAAPTAYDGAVPWASSIGANAEPDTIAYVCDNGGGCNIAGGASSVFVLHSGALLISLGWFRRRRARS